MLLIETDGIHVKKESPCSRRGFPFIFRLFKMKIEYKREYIKYN